MSTPLVIDGSLLPIWARRRGSSKSCWCQNTEPPMLMRCTSSVVIRLNNSRPMT